MASWNAVGGANVCMSRALQRVGSRQL